MGQQVLGEGPRLAPVEEQRDAMLGAEQPLEIVQAGAAGAQRNGPALQRFIEPRGLHMGVAHRARREGAVA